MKRIFAYGLFLVLLSFLAYSVFNQSTTLSTPSVEASAIYTDTYGEKLGTVQFPTSCSDVATPQVKRGVALLHHMTYAGARAAFTAATRTDPQCAMGYWGQAMTYIHPLWSDAPTKEDFKQGESLVNNARVRGEKTDREHAFIAAVGAYYVKGWNKDEAVNLKSFEAGWKKVYLRYPKDIEAASFYALAHMATANPGDKTYKQQERSAAIANKVLALVDDHPGAHHYLIHAYDYPRLAPKALNVARSYGEIAPDIPHALHMPTHIFTRVGLWDESITMNKRSASAALKHPVGNEISLHYPHALDYLAYAYLQKADDDKARQVMEELVRTDGAFQTHIAASYSFTAIPARYALERQQWRDAAALEPGLPTAYQIEKFPAMEAIIYFAKALGAARSGNEAIANQSLEKLTALQKEAEKKSTYWAKQVEIQRLSAKAWITYHKGKHEEALNIMKAAADLESSTEKHPVTPGEILPARELLADMLLDMGRYREARTEYEKALQRSANRFNSLYGAGLASELGNDGDRAVFYYKKLVEITKHVNTNRKQLNHAKSYLSQNRVSS